MALYDSMQALIGNTPLVRLNRQDLPDGVNLYAKPELFNPADPVGSTMGGGEHADYDIEGIGNDFIPDTMDMSLVDQVVKVTDNEAFRAARAGAHRRHFCRVLLGRGAGGREKADLGWRPGKYCGRVP